MTSDLTNRGAGPCRPPAPSSSHPPAARPAAVARDGCGEEQGRDTSTLSQLRPGLWDPASGRFNTARLRAAIVSRGWTVAEFAVTAGISRACLYNALRAWATSDRTAITIATTLATREPLPVLVAE
jgi:lambda repressor-like predicted transcriptional regulator